MAVILLLLALLVPQLAFGQTQPVDARPVHVICDSGCGSGGVGASVDISSVAGNIIVGGDVPVAFTVPQHVIIDSMPAGGAGLTDAELRASAVSVNFTNTTIALSAGAATIGAVNLAQYTPVSGRLPVDGSGVTQPVSHANFANLDAALSTLLTTSAFQARVNTLGQKTMAASTPIVVASDQTAIPVSGTVTVTDGAGALNVIVDSATLGTVTVSDGAGALNTILDSGTLTSITNAVTVTDGAGALNVIVDSGTITAVTAITNALPAGTNNIGDVDVLTLPALPAGTNNIGDVDVLTLPALVAGSALIGKVGIDQTTPGTTNRVDIGVFPDNEPINIAQMNSVAVSMGVGASGTGTQRVASLIHDGTDIALVTADGSLQAEPPRTNYMSIGGQESVAAPTADVWYVRKQWALPASAHFNPSTAWATITTALTKTLIGIANSLGTLNVGTNAFAATNSVASPFHYARLFGCVTTVFSATADTITPTYTDELGNSQAATGVAFASATPVGNCYEFPLAAGVLASAQDAGVRAVTAAVDTAATTGVVTFYGVNPLADFAGTAANQTETATFPQMPELNSNEQIFILMRQAATTAQLKTFGIGGALR